jgi:large subunit ribosomal protein L25
MAEAVKIQAEARDAAKNKGTGTRVARKLRASGRIPAIVYGHKQAPAPISIARDAIWDMIKKSTHLAELHVGGGTETVLVKDVQWDHLGKEIIHVDFSRVDLSESVTSEVRLDLKGDAPGLAEGGILELVHHTLTVTSRADAIPDSIKVDVANLHLNQSIHAKDIALPEGVTLKGDPEALIVHVTTRAAAAEPTAEGEASLIQPEVIKPERKEKED